MTTRVLSRSAERHAVGGFLAAARSAPTVLVLEGEAGIGKTTLWLDALDQAQRLGFRVLAAQATEAETVLAYSGVADLLGDLEPEAFAHLPVLQRLAVDRVLLRAEGDPLVTDHRVAAASFVSIVSALAADGPVLIAVDDVQWLDPSSRTILAFAARRLRGPIGILATERCDLGKDTTSSWLRLDHPSELRRSRVGPLGLGALHSLISSRLGRSLPRRAMVRIEGISCGNPFYAVELARSMAGRPLSSEPPLPETLSELVRSRIGRLDDDVRNALLGIASVAAPTIDLLARLNAVTTDELLELLAGVETDGIVTIAANRIRFTHPLLAHGVYTDASPAARRAMHRALADIVDGPELRARHLALATTSHDEATLAALDAAADSARARGAPAAAAELLDLAIGLGGDKPWRRVRAAGDHFQAGTTDHAENLLTPIVDQLRPGMLRAIALNLLAAIRIYDNNFVTATDLLTRAVDDSKDVPPILVQTLMHLSFAQGHGAFAEGTPPQGMFDEVMRNAREAVEVAEKSGMPGLQSQALTHWVAAQFMHGHGIDDESLRRALELEPHDADVPIPFKASACDALIDAYVGRLDDARTKMIAVGEHYRERGSDHNVMNVSSYLALIEMWSGNFAAATAFADEAVERAEQLGSGAVDVIALSIRASVFAHTGREKDALADADAALASAHACDAPRMAEWPMMAKGFMELSLGKNAEALRTFDPLIERLGIVPGTEIMACWYLPNAAEAMIALDRLDDAEPLITALERNGAALDRPWMISAGARCRAMALAAKGEVAAAIDAAQYALTQHDRTAMRFEQARTTLLLGKLQRRRRQKTAAHGTLSAALAAFEEMGTPLWANQAREELARTNVRMADAAQLTPSERRVCELAASGMTNRDIAAQLFIHPKTVETNLSRAYAKLGIRSRTELGRRLQQSPSAE
ncbi:MAG: AAA family ATPase [Mycobacterium sp.]